MRSSARFASAMLRLKLCLFVSFLVAAIVVATPHHVLASGNGDPIAFSVTATSLTTSGHLLFIDNAHTNQYPGDPNMAGRSRLWESGLFLTRISPLSH
jgi:hypothetical protein